MLCVSRWMRVQVVDGNLIDQDVEVIVNAWNRNIFPWWLLLPQGVSGEIKRRGGTAPFRELRSAGLLALGDAVMTGAGKLPFRAIIHVAGIGLLWRASRRSVVLSVRNAIAIAARQNFRTVAFPLVGAGTGGLSPDDAQRLIASTLASLPFDGDVRIVRYRGTSNAQCVCRPIIAQGFDVALRGLDLVALRHQELKYRCAHGVVLQLRGVQDSFTAR